MQDMLESLIVLLVLAFFWGYPSLCIWLIARKTNADLRWMAWIPILNLYLVCKIGGQSGWWVLLCLVPYVGAIVAMLLLLQLPKALGVTNATRFLIIVPLVNFIYLGYLAFRTEHRASPPLVTPSA